MKWKFLLGELLGESQKNDTIQKYMKNHWNLIGWLFYIFFFNFLLLPVNFCPNFFFI